MKQSLRTRIKRVLKRFPGLNGVWVKKESIYLSAQPGAKKITEGDLKRLAKEEKELKSNKDE